jgi:hypothetical protein
MGRFVLDNEEYGSGVARPAQPEAILDGTSCVEFRRTRIDVAVSRAGDRRAPWFLESYRSLLARAMFSRGKASTKDIWSAWQDQVPRTDKVAFTMTNFQRLGAERRSSQRVIDRRYQPNTTCSNDPCELSWRQPSAEAVEEYYANLKGGPRRRPTRSRGEAARDPEAYRCRDQTDLSTMGKLLRVLRQARRLSKLARASRRRPTALYARCVQLRGSARIDSRQTGMIL